MVSKHEMKNVFKCQLTITSKQLWTICRRLRLHCDHHQIPKCLVQTTAAQARWIGLVLRKMQSRLNPHKCWFAAFCRHPAWRCAYFHCILSCALLQNPQTHSQFHKIPNEWFNPKSNNSKTVSSYNVIKMKPRGVQGSLRGHG